MEGACLVRSLALCFNRIQQLLVSYLLTTFSHLIPKTRDRYFQIIFFFFKKAKV